ncbi:MAG: hypothetical protein M9933_02005 [Chitinophagaceae bacterium]|nr:hypothetical protein [Chitinophagaceae bacterium]
MSRVALLITGTFLIMSANLLAQTEKQSKPKSGNNKKEPVKNVVSTAQDFNTTRSNRQNSNYNAGIATDTGNSNPANADSVPKRQEAQDFNTTRSNRQNSNYNAGIATDTGNNNPANADSVPKRQEAQDFNTTRSNRQNSNYNAGIATGTGNSNPANADSVPKRQEAQDFNTTRSNRQNSNYNAGIITNPGNNNCIEFNIDAGLSEGRNVHAGSGFRAAVELTKSITQNIRVSAGVTYYSLKLSYDSSPDLPKYYVENMENSVGSPRWSLITLNAGPVIRFGKSKLYADLYGKVGVSFIKIPKQIVGITGRSGKVDDETGVAKFSGNKTAPSLQTGIHISYAISRNTSVFIHPQFFTTLGSSASYLEKDATKALVDGKTFDYKTFMALPFEKKTTSLQAIAIGAGVKIYLCGK